MAMKWLPHAQDWDKLVLVHKISKFDNGFRKALEEFWKLDTDQYDKRLAALPRLGKLIGELRKAKDVIAAGPGAVKLVGEVVDVVPVVRKAIEQQKKDFETSGAHPVDVQFIVVDWNGKPFSRGDGYVVFQSPGVPKVTKACKLSANGLDIDDVRLRPSGTVNLTIHPGSGDSITGTTAYEFKPGKAVVKFKAVQHSQPFKTRGKSLDEVTRKVGFKGSLGVDYKVIKIGGEATREEQVRETLEEEVEWQLQAGLPTFKEFSQI